MEFSTVIAFIFGVAVGFLGLGLVGVWLLRRVWQQVQGNVETLRLQGVSIFTRVDSILTNWIHLAQKLDKLDEIARVIEQLKNVLLTDNPLPGDVPKTASPFVVPVGGLNLTGGFVELSGKNVSPKPANKKTTKPRKKK